MVKMLVELLSNQVKEKLLVVMALRLLYVCMAKYDWRVLFATEGGVRAVLGCMQEYSTSALVQQAGLAVSSCRRFLVQTPASPGRAWEESCLELWRATATSQGKSCLPGLKDLKDRYCLLLTTGLRDWREGFLALCF